MPNPIYSYEHLKPAFHLRYTWTGWPTSGTQFPPRPDETFFGQLDTAWKFVDPRFSEMLRRFTIIAPTVALDEPSESNSGRYWYNLHFVLVVASLQFWLWPEL
jgi:hypothetical protein